MRNQRHSMSLPSVNNAPICAGTDPALSAELALRPTTSVKRP
jgi:hypothetical protein